MVGLVAIVAPPEPSVIRIAAPAVFAPMFGKSLKVAALAEVAASTRAAPPIARDAKLRVLDMRHPTDRTDRHMKSLIIPKKCVNEKPTNKNTFYLNLFLT